MRATRPLFRFDPGWLFIAAGLAVCAAGVLLPAQADLRSLEEQLSVLHDEESRAYQRLAAHADFIDQVDRNETSIIRRLAAAQLNLVPEGDKPVILAASNTAPVTSWIDSTLVTDIRPAEFEPVSTLSRWANGPSRLWMFGSGIMAVFIGLLMSPEGSKRRARANAMQSHANEAMAWGGSAVGLLDEDDDAADLARAQAIAIRFANPEPSLPATVDLDDGRDLSQQEDTVDLEESELPVLSRTVIDDDAAWHNAATIEHASEVVIEGREVVRPDVQPTLWEDDVNESDEAIPPFDATASDDDSADDEADGDLETEVQTTADDWTGDDAERLAAAAMPMPASNDDDSSADEDAPFTTTASIAESKPEQAIDVDDGFGEESPPQVSMEALKAELNSATTASEVVKPARKRAALEGKKPSRRALEQEIESSQAQADAAADRASKSRKNVKPNAASASTRDARKPASSKKGDAAAIPFLRYRPTEEDEAAAVEDDEDESIDAASDDGEMIAMEAADSDEIDGDASDADDDASMKFNST